MGVKVDGKGTAAPENPLVPNSALREMYRKLVEGRLLEAYESRGKRRPKATSSHEASLVSITQGLAEGDLVMPGQPGGLMKYLLGTKLTGIFPPPGKKKDKSKPRVASTRVLPFIEDAETRLFAALGAAMLQKRMKGADLTVVFIQKGQISTIAWRRALTLAAANALPVIFVALQDGEASGRKSKAKPGISGLALQCKLPGIPVDAIDVVALYRVAQESVGRIRIGGGPVIIEGVSFMLEGRREFAESDAVVQIGETLLRRGAATRAWMAGLEKSFRNRLTTLEKS